MAAAGQHAAEEIALLVVERTHLALVEQLGEAEDGIERRAQLVGHVGQELRLVRAGRGEFLRLLLQTQPRFHQRGVLLLQRAPLCLQLARLPLRFRQQRAQLGPAPRHVERDGQRLPNRSDQFGGQLLPGLQAGQREDAGHFADAEQGNQRDRARRSLGQPRADPKLVRRRVHHRDLGLERGLPDQALARAEARVPFAPRERVPSEQTKVPGRVEVVERSHRAVEMAAESGHRAVRHLARLQLAAQLLGKGRLGALQPVDAAPLGLEPLEVVGHLVGLPGQVAHLVPADRRDGGAEIALAEAAKPGRQVAHAAQHVAADPEREEEHHRQAGEAEDQAQARTSPLRFRRRGEGVGQLRLVEDGGLVEEFRRARLAGLHLPHPRHDALAGLAGDEAGGDCQALGVKVLDRLFQRGGEAGLHRVGGGGQLLEEFLLQRDRPGKLLGVAGRDGVLESALDPLELRLQLRSETHLRQVAPPDVFQVSFHALGNDRAGDAQRDQRERSRRDEDEQLRSERESQWASVHVYGPGAVQVGAGSHVADRAGMAHHVGDHRVVAGQLGRREALAGEDLLLPVAPHRGDRAGKDLLRETAARRRVGSQVDRADGRVVGPACRAAEEELGDELAIETGDGIGRMRDEDVGRSARVRGHGRGGECDDGEHANSQGPLEIRKRRSS